MVTIQQHTGWKEGGSPKSAAKAHKFIMCWVTLKFFFFRNTFLY